MTDISEVSLAHLFLLRPFPWAGVGVNPGHGVKGLIEDDDQPRSQHGRAGEGARQQPGHEQGRGPGRDGEKIPIPLAPVVGIPGEDEKK